MTTSYIFFPIGGGYWRLTYGCGGLAVILTFLIFYLIYRKSGGERPGCFNVFLLPLLPIAWADSLFGKLNELGIEADLKATGVPFTKPPSLTLKILVALSGAAVWVLGICLMAIYDISVWWVMVWIVAMPLVFINLYILWLNLFFVRLGKLRDRTATVVCIIAILLIVLFWIFAIDAFCYYTSDEYMIDYWNRKYLPQFC